MYTCPVCGYPRLEEPPEEHTICPSCGTQFGYSDEGPLSKAVMHAELRRYWIAHSAEWTSMVIPKPSDWNGYNQIIQAGYGFDLPWPRISVTIPLTYTKVASMPQEGEFAHG